jgi:hypothetical protein
MSRRRTPSLDPASRRRPHVLGSLALLAAIALAGCEEKVRLTVKLRTADSGVPPPSAPGPSPAAPSGPRESP